MPSAAFRCEQSVTTEREIHDAEPSTCPRCHHEHRHERHQPWPDGRHHQRSCCDPDAKCHQRHQPTGRRSLHSLRFAEVVRPERLGERAHRPDAFPTRRIRCDHALIHEGNPFETLYFVCAGSFKCVQVDAEGYEQVLGFALHADMIGLDGISRGLYACGAVALEDATVAALPWAEVEQAVRRIPAMERLFQRAVGAELLRRSDTQYLMSAASSEVRVARFLLHYARRQNALGYSDRRIRLRMTRRDIASHLGVAHETVSRALTALSDIGGIGVAYRDIEILNPGLLQAIQKVTRGSWKTALTAHAEATGRPVGGSGPSSQAPSAMA